MYSLTICFGPAATSWMYLFKEEEKASVLYNAYVEHKMNHAEGGVLIGSDDFGQSFAMPFDEIRGVMLEDLDLTEQARIERSMVDARAQTKFNQRAKNDPTIRAAMQGPSVISPMGAR
jgi:hypothetical protein